MAPKYILEQFIETELLVNITEHMVKTFFCAYVCNTNIFSNICKYFIYFLFHGGQAAKSLCYLCESSKGLYSFVYGSFELVPYIYDLKNPCRAAQNCLQKNEC